MSAFPRSVGSIEKICDQQFITSLVLCYSSADKLSVSILTPNSSEVVDFSSLSTF